MFVGAFGVGVLIIAIVRTVLRSTFVAWEPVFRPRGLKSWTPTATPSTRTGSRQRRVQITMTPHDEPVRLYFAGIDEPPE